MNDNLSPEWRLAAEDWALSADEDDLTALETDLFERIFKAGWDAHAARSKNE